MYQEWIKTLDSCILFGGIEETALEVMLECLKPRVYRYKQREIIVATGQSFQGIGIIASGSVVVTRETYSGNRIIMGIMGEGDIFGETVAFSDTRVWPATVIAQEDSVILFLPPDKIIGTCSNICASHSALIKNRLRILSNRAYMLGKKIEHLSEKNIRGKISSYLLEVYEQQNKTNTFTIPLKRHEMADYLNIPRPSLSREMALMRDEGIIEFDRSDITIKNKFGLEAAME